jgi:hypothetical protein
LSIHTYPTQIQEGIRNFLLATFDDFLARKDFEISMALRQIGAAGCYVGFAIQQSPEGVKEVLSNKIFGAREDAEAYARRMIRKWLEQRDTAIALEAMTCETGAGGHGCYLRDGFMFGLDYFFCKGI